MQANHEFSFLHGFRNLINNFRKRHRRRIENLRALLGNLQHIGINQRTRVNNHVRFFEKPLSFDRDKFRIAGTRADNKYLHPVLPPKSIFLTQIAYFFSPVTM